MTCVYCGDKKILPYGYDIFGSRNQCLRKGFGTGSFSEKRKWQRRMGLPVDPEYISNCGENRRYIDEKKRDEKKRDEKDRKYDEKKERKSKKKSKKRDKQKRKSKKRKTKVKTVKRRK